MMSRSAKWRLRAAAAPVAYNTLEDWVVQESSEEFVEGSQLEFKSLAWDNYADARWRHGFDSRADRFAFFGEEEGYSKTDWSRAANGTMTVTPAVAPV